MKVKFHTTHIDRYALYEQGGVKISLPDDAVILGWWLRPGCRDVIVLWYTKSV